MSKAIKDNFKDGKPLHISDPEHSMFRIVDKETWALLSPNRAQHMLKMQCLLIPDNHRPASGFNEETWWDLLECGLSRPLDVIGNQFSSLLTCSLTIFQIYQL